MRLLTEERISTVPGIGYGDSCDGFIRVSVGTESMERTRHGIVMVDQLIHQMALEKKARVAGLVAAQTICARTAAADAAAAEALVSAGEAEEVLA